MKHKYLDLELFEIKDGKLFYDGKEKKTRLNSQGYVYITINKKGVRVHRLVAMKYVPNPDNKQIVDHIDSDKENFEPTNLRWLSPMYSSHSLPM